MIHWVDEKLSWRIRSTGILIGLVYAAWARDSHLALICIGVTLLFLWDERHAGRP